MIKSTERVPGMFGTLVICLPSEHTGGTVCLQHGTKKEGFDTSEFSAFDATCIAWFVSNISSSTILGLRNHRYADVTHEVSKSIGVRFKSIQLILWKDRTGPIGIPLGSHVQSYQRFQGPRSICHYP